MARLKSTNYNKKKNDILNNAADVFAEFGVEKATMTQIAKRCEVSKALLYHYYKSKNELISDIVISSLEELETALEDTLDEYQGSSSEEMLRQLIRQTLECYRDADSKHKVQLNSQNILSEEELRESYEIQRRIVRIYSSTISQIRPDLAQNTNLIIPITMSIFGMLNWAFTWLKSNGLTRTEYADLVTTLSLEGLKSVK